MVMGIAIEWMCLPVIIRVVEVFLWKIFNNLL